MKAHLRKWKKISLLALLFLMQSCPLTNLYKKYGAFGSPESPANAMDPVLRVLKDVNKQLHRDVENLAQGRPSGGIGMLASFLGSGGKGGSSMTPLKAVWTKEKVSVTRDTFNLMSRSSHYDTFIKSIDELVNSSVANWDGNFSGVTEIMELNTSNCVYDFFTDMHIAEDQMETEIENLKTKSEISFLHKRIEEAKRCQRSLEEQIIDYVKYRNILSFSQPSRGAESAAALVVELLTDLAETKGSEVMTKEKIMNIWEQPLGEHSALAKRVCAGITQMNQTTALAHEKAGAFFTDENKGFASLIGASLSEANKKMDEFNREVWTVTGRGVSKNNGNYAYRFQLALCGALGIPVTGVDPSQLRHKFSVGKSKADIKKEKTLQSTKKKQKQPPVVKIGTPQK